MQSFKNIAKKVQKQKLDVLKTLGGIPLLSGLKKAEISKLAKGLKRKEFKQGDYLMKEGELGDSFYLIVEGAVEVVTKKGGKIATLEEGDYAGEQSLLSSSKEGAKRNASLICKTTPTICLIVSQKTFKKILAENTSVNFAKRDAKRNAFYTAIKFENDEKDDKDIEDLIKDNKTPFYKTNNTIKWLLNCVKDNLLFNHLQYESQSRLVKRMQIQSVKKGEKIITQGDTNAHTFYVVDLGDFDVLVDGVKVVEYHKGGCFGELALLYDAPRAATIECCSKTSRVWVITRDAFRWELMNLSKKKLQQSVRFLKNIDLFKPLLKNELMQLADSLELKDYNEKDVIFNQGDLGDKFYIVKNGVVKWTKVIKEKSKKDTVQSGELKPGMYFGERALRTKETRAATINVISKTCTLYEMSGEFFVELLGPVLTIIDSKIESYNERLKHHKESIIKTKEKNLLKTQNFNKQNDIDPSKICGLKELKTIGVLGKGGFGLVTLVIDPKSKKTYALKAIKKFQVVELELQKHIISEKKVMDIMTNKFLVNLHRTYKDKLRVYFLLDVCLGGELFTILRQRRYFNEPTSRFYAACVIEAFDYMHSLDIIYRDLKPENLVLDSTGYLRVTDFGFAKVISDDKTFTLCGTPDYLCPEIVTGQGHGKGVDWWTLGILIYEMLASFPPFVADDPVETYRKIIRGRIRFPRYFSQDVRELIRGLLHSKPTRRLGILNGGANLIRKHAWYKSFSWEKILDGSMPAPIVNKVKNKQDLSNFQQIEIEDEEAKPVKPEDDFDDIF